MGAGKTVVGRCLADRLGRDFLDLDDAIEVRMGMTIAEVFSSRGEDVFRRAETHELETTTRREDLVVATGGGAFSNPENRRVIDRTGVSVFLDPPWSVICRRLADDSSTRPKWTDERHARGLYDDRLEDYRKASVHLEFDGDETPGEIASRIAAAVVEFACAS